MRQRWPAGILSITVLATLLVAALSGTSPAMIRTLPLEDLVSESDLIVVAYVYSVTATKIDPATGTVTLRNELSPIETMKGRWPFPRPIVLFTMRHEGRWVEDNLELPQPGTRVVLFLKKGKSGMLPVNGIQGVWPMQGDKLLQMGTGKTLGEIRAVVKSQRMRR